MGMLCHSQALISLKFQDFMAYFQYFSQVQTDCLLSNFESLLEQAGLRVSKEYSNQAQIFAEDKNREQGCQIIVKVIISWSDKALRKCSIEIRSDEPYSKRNTRCETINKLLHSIIPPHESSKNPKKHD